ncbi:hypothetical protein ACTQ45_05500 [Fundicoccus sp. Sow4_D5]|uniref:hypothetical protein n=1 Tax=Fundicoccus sp. Sow4_D5 TaxID=3438782 RepID=UPI003F8F7359
MIYLEIGVFLKDYEIERLGQQNQRYLEVFEAELKAANLKAKTIEKHLDNTEFYINTYLMNRLVQEMKDGCGYELDAYFGDYFVRKTDWATPATIKANAASIKKFYKAMLTHGHVDKESYDELCDVIKESMSDWQGECESYNDDDGFFF